MSGLLPCPMCNCGDVLVRHVAAGAFVTNVSCRQCCLELARSTEAEAVAAWNTRAPAPVAPGGVITDKQVDAIIQAVMNAAEVEDGLVVACDREPVRAVLSASLSPDAKVGGGWVACSDRRPNNWQKVAVWNPLTGWRGVFAYNAVNGGSWTLNDAGDFQRVKPEHCWFPLPEITKPTTPSTSEGEEHGEA